MEQVEITKTQPASRTTASIRTFHVDIPETELIELRRRILATRWPEKEAVGDSLQGLSRYDAEAGTVLVHRVKREGRMKRPRMIEMAILILGSLALGEARAQQPGTQRKELGRHDMSIPGREEVQVRVDFDPGVAFPKHTHFGEEIIYVIEGTLQYEIEGQPPVTLKAGEVLFVPAGAVHTAKNVGTVNGAELGTYIVEKGKPLVTLVK